MIEYDAPAKCLYVESGGTDSNRGPGKLTLIDAVSGQPAGEIVTGYRAAAMAMEKAGPRLYVAIPAANQIAVIDRRSKTIAARFAGIDVHQTHNMVVSGQQHLFVRAEFQ